MQEIIIDIEIDENGDIKAETKGLKGESCIEELEMLMEELAEIEEVNKTDEYYQKGPVRVRSKQSLKRRY